VEKQSLATIHVEPLGIAASVAAPHIIYLPILLRKLRPSLAEVNQQPLYDSDEITKLVLLVILLRQQHKRRYSYFLLSQQTALIFILRRSLSI
jgi:hypothetical protein